MLTLRVSITKHVLDRFRELGFRWRRWRNGELGIKVYERGGQAVVVIPDIEILPTSIQPIQASIEGYFQQLKRVIEGLMARYSIGGLFFQGGGNIPIPEWFKQWCSENGIRIHIYDIESARIDGLGIRDL